MLPEDENAWLVAQLCRLLRIPSGSGREREVWRYCASELADMGLTIREDRARCRGGQVGNLVATLPGTGRMPAVLLTAHLDTARHISASPRLDPDGWMRNDAVMPLGADGKAGVAAALAAVRWLARSSAPRPTVQVLLTVQEELGMMGVRHADRRLWSAECGLCLDGDAAWYVVYDRGSGAISWRAHVVVDNPKRRVSFERALRRAWLGVNMAGGGEGDSASVRSVRVRVREWRVWRAGMEVGGHATGFGPLYDIAARVRRQVRRAAAEAGVQPKFSWTPVYPPLSGRALEMPRARLLYAASGLGRVPLFGAATGGSDAHWLTHWGIPTLVVGVGVTEAHTERERVRVADVTWAARLAYGFCRIGT